MISYTKSRLTQIINTAKRSPELIQLLEMHNQFTTVTQYGEVIILFYFWICVSDNIIIYCDIFKQPKFIQKPIIKSDMGTQTDTHILETNIVKSYEWNEWELRRKALKLVCSIFFLRCNLKF